MKWMPVREFLRGGYKQIREPTVIANHGHPIFTVMPSMTAPVARADGGRDALPEEATPAKPEDPLAPRPVEGLR